MLSSTSSWLSGRRLLPMMVVGPRSTAAAATTATANCALSTAAAPRKKFDELHVLRLNNLQDNPGAVKKKRRVGRGIGSSKGKTCGKGHKGQRARNRSAIPNGFEGGQTKLWKLLPKRGFNNKYHQKKRGDMAVINLGTIQDYIDMGRFGALQTKDDDDDDLPTLGIVDFIKAGIIKDKAEHPGLKLLSKGKERFTTPVELVVNRASEGAIEAAENVGGLITTVHLNRLAMRTLIRPQRFETVVKGGDGDSEKIVRVLPKQARPPPKLQPYYTSFKNRGYLCPEVQMRDFLRGRPDLSDAFQKALKLESDKPIADDAAKEEASEKKE